MKRYRGAGLGRARFAGVAAVVILAAAAPAFAAGKLRVVASTTDLASIAAAVGGDRLEVSAVCRGAADPHRVEVLPSYMVRVARADLYLKVGLGLDPWADGIIDGSHNGKLTVVDCSSGVAVLEKPTGKVDASMGDIHPDGNPHYWLNPANGAVVARTLAAAFAARDPAGAAAYDANAAAFATAATAMAARCAAAGAKRASRTIVTYHRSWSYFAAACGLTVVSTIEPVPGIPPTGRHLQELVDLIHGQKVGLVLVEPYFSSDAGKFLARETGVTVATASPSCDDATAGSYLAHFEALLDILATGGS
jgi:zinc/manganese transport system substrate-binding protein